MCWNAIVERVLNISGFKMCKVSVYASVTQNSEYGWTMTE